jgi:hypothetical protein
MLRYLLLALTLGALLLPGCQKDDDNQPYVITEADFVGRWSVPQFESTFNRSGTFIGTPMDQNGTTSISQSDLQLQLSDNGTWTSSGDYSLTVATDTETDVSQRSGIGQGSWSYRNDTLFLRGLESYADVGSFTGDQACVLTDFTRDAQIKLTTRIDQTDSDVDFGTSLRTQAEWRIILLR